MALKIQIKNEKGIITEYHRILNVSASADGNMKVNIASYAGSEYRELEIEDEKNRKEYDNNMKALEEELHKSVEEKDDELISILSKKINSALEPQMPYHIFENTYTFAFDKNTSVSYSDVYAALKQLPQFEGAEDV